MPKLEFLFFRKWPRRNLRQGNIRAMGPKIWPSFWGAENTLSQMRIDKRAFREFGSHRREEGKKDIESVAFLRGKIPIPSCLLLPRF